MTFACSLCGREAGTLELAGGELRRRSFTSTLTQPLSPAAAAAVAAGDAAGLFALDPELTPFYCPDCGAVYCARHWDRWDVFDEDGWHDSIRGRCPRGHERMLED